MGTVLVGQSWVKASSFKKSLSEAYSRTTICVCKCKQIICMVYTKIGKMSVIINFIVNLLFIIGQFKWIR